MIFKRLLVMVAMGAALSCSSGKYPLPAEPKPAPKEPEEEPGEEPGEDPGTVDPPVEVTLAEAFDEGFDAATVPSFLVLDTSGGDFRFFPGFPSFTESGKTVMMIRLTKDGASITTKDYVHFGSYSVRMKLPDITSVQPKLGARVEFGPEELAIGIDLASPTVAGNNSASKFFIFGMDWSAEKVTRWVKATASGTAKEIDSITENVPQTPQKLSLKYFCPSGTAAPAYPYELEIDWIKYTPSEQ